jgi:hypothetical protein
MTLITRSSNASIDASTAMYAPQLTGLVAGENLDVVAPCYIKTSDGKVWMSNATSANEAAEVAGFTPRAVKSGEPVTLFGAGARFRYGSSLTPGNILYLGATAGRLDSGATTGDSAGVAMVINTEDIVIFRSAPYQVTGSVADGAVTTGKIADVNVTEAKIEVGAAGAGLTGLVTKFVADNNVIGGIPVIHKILIAAGSNGNTDVTLTHKTRIVDVIVHPRTSVTSATLQAKNGTTNAITDAMVAAVAGVNTHATSVAIAYDTIAAGGVLRITGAGGATQPDADVYVLGFREA